MQYDLLDKEYGEGKLAFESGRLETDNPYPKYESGWHLWLAGYSAAEFNLLRA